MTNHFKGSVLEHRGGVRRLFGSSPTNKMASTERKEALWGERAHLPVSGGVSVRIVTNGNILSWRGSQSSPFTGKWRKGSSSGRAEPIGAELCTSSRGVSGPVPLGGQSVSEWPFMSRWSCWQTPCFYCSRWCSNSQKWLMSLDQGLSRDRRPGSPFAPTP